MNLFIVFHFNSISLKYLMNFLLVKLTFFLSFNESTIFNRSSSYGAEQKLKFHLFQSNPSGFTQQFHIFLLQRAPTSSKKHINSITNWVWFSLRSTVRHDCQMKLIDMKETTTNLLQTPTCWCNYRFLGRCFLCLSWTTERGRKIKSLLPCVLHISLW